MAKRLRVIDRTKSRTEYGFDFLETDNKAQFLQQINALIDGVSDDVKIRVDNYDGSCEIEITSFRDETDAEMAQRLERNKNRVFKERTAKQRAASEKKIEELRELRRLMEKYQPNKKTFLDDIPPG